MYHTALREYFTQGTDSAFVFTGGMATPSQRAAHRRTASWGILSSWPDSLRNGLQQAFADSSYGEELAWPVVTSVATSLGLSATLPDSTFGRQLGKFSPPHFAMSRPGFNADSTIAVIEVGYHCGRRCGSGGILYLSRHPGQGWTAWHLAGAWIS